MIALACVGAIGAALIVVAEDVIAGNGLELRAAASLQLVTTYRSDGLIEAARLMTNLGSVSVLIPLARISVWFLWFRGARVAVAAVPALVATVALIVTPIAVFAVR